MRVHGSYPPQYGEEFRYEIEGLVVAGTLVSFDSTSATFDFDEISMYDLSICTPVNPHQAPFDPSCAAR